MEYSVSVDGNTLFATLDGQLDSNTAPVLEKAIKEQFTDKIESIEINFERIKYISSSGLRVLISLYKQIKSKKVILINPNEFVLEVLRMTNTDSFITVENR